MDLNVGFIKSVLNIYDEMISKGISLVYFGEFSHQITKMFSEMAETEADKNEEDRAARRRIYHAVVETLQNMNKHSDEIAEKGNVGKGLYMIGRMDDIYYIITSNKVSREKVEGLMAAIDEVNNCSPEELKALHRKQLVEGKLSKKGGAGLGLIDIARKSGRKLRYLFMPQENKASLFILKIEIDTKSRADLLNE